MNERPQKRIWMKTIEIFNLRYRNENSPKHTNRQTDRKAN